MSKPSQAQVREINRTLLATVRTDWRYPDPRPSRRMILEPLSYRERYYSTSDGEIDSSVPESEEEESSDDDTVEACWSSPETEVEVNPLDDEKAQVRSPVDKKKGKFNSPDDVAAYLECKTQKRKRRRTRILAEELRWNQGLCFFMRRRNAWTGASTQEEVQARKDEKAQELDKEETVEETLHDVTKAHEDSSSCTSNEEDTDSSVALSPAIPLVMDEVEQSTSTTSPFDPPEDPLSLINVVSPISIPFLPATHPVRASIMSRSHAELYEKIVRDSRTPAVPLNLTHMMSVIVQGWKDEGNWPPKSALAEAGLLASVRKKSKLKAVAAGAGMTHQQHHSHARTPSDSKIAGLFEGHKHLQRGVESVRRAFRLSGSAPPPGD